VKWEQQENEQGTEIKSTGIGPQASGRKKRKIPISLITRSDGALHSKEVSIGSVSD
jgi:hypothetical protein